MNRFWKSILATIILAGFALAFIPGISAQVGTITRRLIGVQDIRFATGGTGAAETYNYTDPSGNVLTLTKPDASHLKFRTPLWGTARSVDSIVPRIGYEIWVGDPLYPTFAAAVATLNSAGTSCVLRLPSGTHSVSADLAINSNISLQANKGALIAIATAKTLTINGPLDAGRYKIFTLTGTGAVAGLKEVFPEWFGATGDGTTDDSDALTASVAACAEGGVIFFAKGVYKTTGLLVSKTLSMISDCPMSYGTATGVVLKAAGNQAYVLKMQGTMVSLASTFVHSQLKNITISGDGKTISDAAFVLEYSHLAKVIGCVFTAVAGTGVRFRTAWELQFNDNFIHDCGVIDTGKAVFIDGPTPLNYNYSSSNISIRNNVWSSNKGRWLEISSLANVDGMWFEGNKLEIDTINMNTVNTNVMHIGAMTRSSISNNTFAGFGNTQGKYANLIWIGGANDDGNNGAPHGPANIIKDNRYHGQVASGAINGLSLAANTGSITEDNNQVWLIDPTVSSVPNVNVSAFRQFIKRAFFAFGPSLYTLTATPSIEYPGFVSIHKVPASNSNIPVFIASAAPKLCINDSNTVAQFTTAGVTSYIAKSFDLSQWIGHSDSHLILRVRMRLDAAGDVTVYANPTEPRWTAVPMVVASQNWEWYDFILTTAELSSTDHLLDLFFWAINNGTPKLLVDGMEFKTYNFTVDTITVTGNLLVTGIAPRLTNLDSSAGAVTATLVDAAAGDIGLIHIVRMTDATTSSTLRVTNHITSSPEDFTMATLGATVALRWNGTKWETIYNHGATL